MFPIYTCTGLVFPSPLPLHSCSRFQHPYSLAQSLHILPTRCCVYSTGATRESSTRKFLLHFPLVRQSSGYDKADKVPDQKYSGSPSLTPRLRFHGVIIDARVMSHQDDKCVALHVCRSSGCASCVWHPPSNSSLEIMILALTNVGEEILLKPFVLIRQKAMIMTGKSFGCFRRLSHVRDGQKIRFQAHYQDRHST